MNIDEIEYIVKVYFDITNNINKTNFNNNITKYLKDDSNIFLIYFK